MDSIKETIQSLRQAGYKENKLKVIERSMCKGQLTKKYYKITKNVSSCGKEYSKLEKRHRTDWYPKNIFSYKQSGDNLVLWPIEVK